MATQQIRWQLSVNWNGDGTTFVDETSRLIAANINCSVNEPGTPTIAGGNIIAQCTLICGNADRRYSANNPDSDLYAYTNYGEYHHRAVRLNVSVDGGSNYYRRFSGVIAGITEITPTTQEAGTVSIDCRDYAEKYLNTRTSTQLGDMVLLYTGSATEADIIEQFMSDCGAINVTTDPGMFVVPFGWMDDESPIEECWSLAAACGGWFYADIWSTTEPAFVYKNASHWAKQTISTSGPDNEFTRSDYEQLQIKYQHDELFKEVTVEWSARQVGSTDVIWEPDSTIVVPADGTKTVTATFRTPIYSLDTLTYSAINAGGVDVSSAVSHELGTVYAQRVEITFTNTHATYAAVLKNVVMTGRPIEGGPEGEITKTSTNSYWSDGANPDRIAKKRAMRSNIWLQTEAQADVLADMLVDVHEQPPATYTLSGVLGDPQRKLGQKIRIYDPTAFATANEKAYIVAMDESVGISGYKQTITAMDSEAIGYRYAETDPAYFVIGTSRISINSGDAGSNRGRLFY